MLHDILQALLSPFIMGGGYAAIVMTPFIVMGLVAKRRKEKYERDSIEPFKELPLRPPGESLRIKIEGLNERFNDQFTSIAVVGVASCAIFVVAPASHKLVVGCVAGLIAIAVQISAGRRLLHLQREFWNHRLGFTGERLVGEELNQLMAAGFRVFHDVPFETFNLDHVIVGPPGVYVVETKTRRKSARIEGPDKAKVIFDGSRVHFPDWSDSAALDQARLNAKTLGQWLTQATGEPVTAKAILTYPGWFIERRAKSDVNVLNPGEIKHSFPALSRIVDPLSPDRIQRIAYQLTERCRLVKE